eukprot:gnl/MRDRNA2_/MRDRNA2_192029_c0_seq1.p1 gnl/MRDRNA2_/MRDRNA2_192029_c0~~gnl/MRDRNA2_/MRDRNA2_192029_c0_seq1.p1  ORF type:complete len:296 (+),score=31.10 gnl/MRDRNA2_/MRDRNA2_192029_c0_seq1:83-970(+)
MEVRCAVCLEESPPSPFLVMPCCGRPGSSAAFCKDCIDRICFEGKGRGICPCCRARFQVSSGEVSLVIPGVLELMSARINMFTDRILDTGSDYIMDFIRRVASQGAAETSHGGIAKVDEPGSNHSFESCDDEGACSLMEAALNMRSSECCDEGGSFMGIVFTDRSLESCDEEGGLIGAALNSHSLESCDGGGSLMVAALSSHSSECCDEGGSLITAPLTGHSLRSCDEGGSLMGASLDSHALESYDEGGSSLGAALNNCSSECCTEEGTSDKQRNPVTTIWQKIKQDMMLCVTGW